MGSKSIEAISKFLGKVRRNRKGFKKIISLKHLEVDRYLNFRSIIVK